MLVHHVSVLMIEHHNSGSLLEAHRAGTRREQKQAGFNTTIPWASPRLCASARACFFLVRRDWVKLLQRYESMSEAHERAAFLRSRGIAAHVEGTTALRPAIAHKSLYNAALWSVLDHQHDDAQALLENPDHVVTDPLDSGEMDTLEDEGGTLARATIIRWSLGILAALIALATVLPSLLD